MVADGRPGENPGSPFIRMALPPGQGVPATPLPLFSLSQNRKSPEQKKPVFHDETVVFMKQLW